MVAEPVIYLVVWTTIAEDSGGTVGGLTTGELAAYYIVWTFVRNMNLVFTPFGWEWRIREGELSGLAPAAGAPDPLRHRGLRRAARCRGCSSTCPSRSCSRCSSTRRSTSDAAEIAVFAVAIWGAYLIRTFNQSALGMLCFWTTRVSAAFSLYIMVELLLSGRLVPMTLMPDWVQTLAWFLPFQWTFYFPIETLVGDSRTPSCSAGWACRSSGSSSASAIFSLVWRRADQALHGGGQLMTTLRVALLHLRVGIMNDLQYRVNFALQVLQSLLALFTGLVVFALVYSHTTELNGWSQDELLAVLGVQILMGGVIRAVIQPNMMRFTEDVRDGQARPRADEAGRRADARQRPPGGGLAGRGRPHGRGRDRRRDDSPRRRSRSARHPRVRRRARPRRRPSLLLLDAAGHTRVLGREHVAPARAVRGRVPDRALADRHLPDVASLQRDVPRADRVRGDGAGGGGDVAPRVADAGARGRVRGRALRASRAGSGASASRTTPARRHDLPPRRPGTTASSRAGGRSSTSTGRRSSGSGRSSRRASRRSTPRAGPGDCSCRISRRGSTSTARDISPDMLDRVRERCEREGLPQPNLYAQAMHELDLPRRYRTIIVCGGFGLGGRREHDVEGLRRLYEHLEPGGTLVLDNEVPYADRRRGRTGRRRSARSCRGLGGTRVTGGRSADGDELELRSRLVDVDPLAQRVTHRDACVPVARRRGRSRGAAHARDDVVLHTRARAHARARPASSTSKCAPAHEDRPPTADDDFVVFIARK